MAGSWIPRALDTLGAVLEGVETVQRRRAEQKRAREARARVELEHMRSELERTLTAASDIGGRFAEALERGDLEEMKRLNEEAQRAGLWPRR